MKRASEIDRYMKNPQKLIDTLDDVVKRYALNKPSDIQPDRIIQFSEISRTIDRLKEAGAIVPDELRKLKIELSHEAAEYEKASANYREALLVLKDMEIRLNNSLTGLRAAISKMGSPETKTIKPKRYVKRTSPSILAKEIRKALRELGGSGKKADVLQKIRQSLDGRFKPQDVERDAQGNLNWEKWVVMEKTKMVKDGTIKSGSAFGIWELRRK